MIKRSIKLNVNKFIWTELKYNNFNTLRFKYLHCISIFTYITILLLQIRFAPLNCRDKCVRNFNLCFKKYRFFFLILIETNVIFSCWQTLNKIECFTTPIRGKKCYFFTDLYCARIGLHECLVCTPDFRREAKVRAFRPIRVQYSL